MKRQLVCVPSILLAVTIMLVSASCGRKEGKDGAGSPSLSFTVVLESEDGAPVPAGQIFPHHRDLGEKRTVVHPPVPCPPGEEVTISGLGEAFFLTFQSDDGFFHRFADPSHLAELQSGTLKVNRTGAVRIKFDKLPSGVDSLLLAVGTAPGTPRTAPDKVYPPEDLDTDFTAKWLYPGMRVLYLKDNSRINGHTYWMSESVEIKVGEVLQLEAVITPAPAGSP